MSESRRNEASDDNPYQSPNPGSELGGTTTGQASAAKRPGPIRELTLFDSISIIVGIIIGAGLYESTPFIAANVSGIGWLMAAWALGGCFALIGALCYSELVTAYPREGGDYVFLTLAYGRRMGFLFAWAELWVIRPGSIGAMGYVFASYAQRLFPLPLEPAHGVLSYACGSIVALTVINGFGVRQGKGIQNLLTTAKVVGLLMVFAVAFFLTPEPLAPATPSSSDMNFPLAMIMVMFAYGGWNEMACVGAEVRDPRKNVVRALLLGTLAVTGIYIVANLAFIHALSLDGLRNSGTVAADIVGMAFGEWGARAASLLICVSALGAINGQIFTGARIFYAMGSDHALYAPLGRWSRRGTPIVSLAAQCAITALLVIAVGSGDGFQRLVIFTAPPFFFFLLLVGLAVFILRRQPADTPRPFSVPGYPLTPIVFCLSSVFMLYASSSYAIQNHSHEALWTIGAMTIGLALSFYRPLKADRDH